MAENELKSSYVSMAMIGGVESTAPPVVDDAARTECYMQAAPVSIFLLTGCHLILKRFSIPEMIVINFNILKIK